MKVALYFTLTLGLLCLGLHAEDEAPDEPTINLFSSGKDNEEGLQISLKQKDYQGIKTENVDFRVLIVNRLQEEVFIEITQLGEASISTGNLSSLSQSDKWANLGRIIAKCNRSRGYGDYFHYHRLAAGQLDAVIESDVNILDIAALSLIITGAGGTFTDLSGAPVDLNISSVLAGTTVLHAQLLSML